MSAHLGHAATLPASRARRPPHHWAVLLGRVLTVVQTRLQLREMDDHLLRDIGLTRRDARREAARAPWDIGPDGGPRAGR